MQHKRRLAHPAHPTARAGLRTFGALFVAAGGVLTLIGMASFFSSFGSFNGPPSYFWCAFVGLPLLGVGLSMLKMGYLGAVTRYVATETVPVAADAVHDFAHDARDGLQTAARAIGSGMPAEPTGTCSECSAELGTDARFCPQCGAARTAAACRACGRTNPSDARFCSGCGTVVTAG